MTTCSFVPIAELITRTLTTTTATTSRAVAEVVVAKVPDAQLREALIEMVTARILPPLPPGASGARAGSPEVRRGPARNRWTGPDGIAARVNAFYEKETVAAQSPVPPPT